MTPELQTLAEIKTFMAMSWLVLLVLTLVGVAMILLELEKIKKRLGSAQSPHRVCTYKNVEEPKFECLVHGV